MEEMKNGAATPKADTHIIAEQPLYYNINLGSFLNQFMEERFVAQIQPKAKHTESYTHDCDQH